MVRKEQGVSSVSSRGRSYGRWRVIVSGDTHDLRDAAKLFAVSDPSVVEEDGVFYLRSSSFEAFTDPQEVLESAVSALPQLNGVASVRLSDFEGVTLCATVVERIDEKTSRVQDSIGVKVREVVEKEGAFSNGLDVMDIPRETASWLAGASSDARVARALAIYGALGDTWVGLYMVLDTLSDDLGGDDAVKKGGFVSRSKIKLLRRTANSYAAAGLGARHALEEYEAPEKPMPLTEGKRVVGQLLDGWLRSKGF